ncbi:hypothetical protein COL922a_007342 [Colletotrichum nupharicola]|nr:hypothetical protein COL922a_007342 [Colletotrichum nupharicola]
MFPTVFRCSQRVIAKTITSRASVFKPQIPSRTPTLNLPTAFQPLLRQQYFSKTLTTSRETLKTKATLEAAREAYQKAYKAHHSARQRLGEAVEEEEERLFEAELQKQALKGKERGRAKESATAEEKGRRMAWWKRLVHGFRMVQGYAQLWMLEVLFTLFESKLARGFYHLVATIAMLDLVGNVVSGLYNIVTITRTRKPRDEDKDRD